MDVVTLIVDLVLVLWAVAVMIGVARAITNRTPRLAPLPDGVGRRYELGWERIASRFVYEPQWAVGEADGLLMSLLSARGHPLDHSRLPRELQQARHDAAAAANGRTKDKTEAMRQVLLEYRAVFRHMLGPRPRHSERSRREMA